MSGHCEYRNVTKNTSGMNQIHAVHPKQPTVSHLARTLAVSGASPPHCGQVRTPSAIGAPQCVQGFVAISAILHLVAAKDGGLDRRQMDLNLELLMAMKG